MSTTKHATGSVLAIRDEQTEFTPHQVAALRQLGVEHAGPADLAVFFHHAQRTGLDPFARQIYMIGRSQWDARTRTSEVKQTIQTSIDGFRLIGRRAADAARHSLSISDALWCGPDGVWRDVWLSEEPPAAAKVTVIRNGGAFPGLALLSEYAGRTKEGKLTKMWAEKPALMLAKCAEALAWRRAFPQDLSGLYTADEMSRVEAVEHVPTPDAPPPATSLRDAIAQPEPDADPQPVDAEVVITAEEILACTTAEELRALWVQAADPDTKAAIQERAAELTEETP